MQGCLLIKWGIIKPIAHLWRIKEYNSVWDELMSNNQKFSSTHNPPIQLLEYVTSRYTPLSTHRI